jgi:uroporphyrinogen decarboxylase
MNSRNRVLMALNHREPDRIPVDLSGHRSSGIAAMAYRRLRRHLGLDDRPIRVYDPIQQLAIVDEDVLQRFGVDTIELGRAFAHEDKWWREWNLPDGSPCLMPVWAMPERHGGEWVLRAPSTGHITATMPPGVLYFEQATYPFEENDDFDRLKAAMDDIMWVSASSPPGPIAAGEDGLKTLIAGAQRLRRESDRAIVGLFGGNLLEMGQFYYRNDNFLMLLAGDPDRAHAFLDRVVELHLASLDRFLGAVGSYIDIILFGDDLGMQSGPQISPKMYQEFFQPRERLMWRRVQELAPHMRIMLHCCGGVRDLLPGLIAAGLDAINPVQITCRGMEPAGLKQDFGGRLTFWGGGCDTREMITKGTPAQVGDHVRRLMDVWRPGGGYVFQQVHNIMADVPPANIVAMFDAVNA